MSSDQSDQRGSEQQGSEPEPMVPPIVVPAGETGASQRAAAADGALQEPAYLHPSSILFDVVSHLRRFLFPALIALWSAAQGGSWGLGIALVLFSLALSTTIFRYLTLRYRIQGSDFVVTQGLIFRRVRSVPIRRIQNVDLVQNPLHRLFGVAEVRIETASGTDPEATLRVLTHAQIEELRQALFSHEEVVSPASDNAQPMGDRPGSDQAGSELSNDRAGQGSELLSGGLASPALSTGAASDHGGSSGARTMQGGAIGGGAGRGGNGTGVLLHQTPLKLLVAAGLASNRGLIILGVIIGLLFQNPFGDDSFVQDSLETGWERVTETAEQTMPATAGYAVWTIAAILIFVAVMLILRLVGIAWYVLRFYDHRLVRHGNDLRISCGLFTKVSATVPRKRVQFISIHRPLFFRWMKLASIRIETAGGGGTENEDATATVSRRWFLPVIAESDIPRLLGELRPELNWEESQFGWVKVSPRTARRLLRVVIAVSLLLIGIGWYFWAQWGALVGVIILVLSTWLTIKKCRAIRYARTDWGVLYRSGLFTRKLSMAFYDRIQAIELSQSPFDRRWKMATLKVDTAAAGPADHAIAVEYLDADYAAEQFRELQVVAAHNKPVWS